MDMAVITLVHLVQTNIKRERDLMGDALMLQTWNYQFILFLLDWLLHHACHSETPDND